MNKFISSFKNKRFKYGSFSAITAAIVIAALIVVNLIFSQFDLKFDLTKNKMYSISDTSKDIVSNLDSEVNIYALYKTGSENSLFTEILEQYSAASDKVNVIYKDPYLYPNFTQKYDVNGEGIDLGSIIVEKGDKFKVISENELVSYDYNYDSYESMTNPSVSSIDIEPQVTNAIRFVSMDSLPIVYYVNGHGEFNMPENLTAQLKSANYEIKELDLFNQEKIPEDCAALIMSAPQNKDYSEKESEIVKDYLAADGRGIVISFITQKMPNFESIMSAYGIVNESNIILEGEPANMLQNSPIYILANIENSEATAEASQRNLRVFSYPAQPLKQAETKNSITIEPILTTSKKSYSKKMESSSPNFEEGDEMGPFNVGVAVTDSYYTDTNHTTKLVILGSIGFLDNSMDSVVSGGNTGFILSCINWLNDSSDNVYITPKSLESESIVVDFASGIVILLVCCVVIPVGFFVTGIVVWLKRRNK